MKNALSIMFSTSIAFTLGFIPAIAEECNVTNLSSSQDPLRIYWNVWCIGTISEVPAQGWSVEGRYCCLAGVGPFSWPVCKSEGVHGDKKVLEVVFSHGCPWAPLAAEDGAKPPTATPAVSVEPVCWCCVGRWPCASAEGGRLGLAAGQVRTTHPPKVYSSGVVRIERDRVASISVQVVDSDGDLRAVFWTQPSNGTVKGELAVFSGPVYEYGAQLQYLPTSCWFGWDSFEVRALDAFGNFSTATVRVQVANVPPQLNQPSIFVVTVDGEPVMFELPAATAAPPYSSNDLKYTVIRRPLHGELRGSGRQYTFIPDSSYCGIDVLEYFVEDPCGARSYGRVELVAQRRPLIYGPSEIKAQRGRKTTFEVLVYDPCHGFPQITVIADSGTYVRTQPVFLDSAVGRWTVVYMPPEELCRDIVDVVRVIATSRATNLATVLDVHVTVVGNQPPQAFPPVMRGETTVVLTPTGVVRTPVVFEPIKVWDPDGDLVTIEGYGVPPTYAANSSAFLGSLVAMYTPGGLTERYSLL